MLRSRRRGQAIVEFGLISLLFVGLLFAVVDFGLLLNTWLAVSSGSRELARSASVGKEKDTLDSQAKNLVIPGLSTDGLGPCCWSPTSALQVTVTYHGDCPSWPECPPVEPKDILNVYPEGTCSSGCAHPVPGDAVKVVLQAHGAQVITPLIRPFFGCSNGNNPKCHVTLSSTTITRFEGQDF